MPIESPDERVYYYECSYGTFRLTYFIPYSDLNKLVRDGQINSQVLVDYPDGVDLRVGESNYNDFFENYGYRPEVNPHETKIRFYTILSSTKDWKQYHGSGLIPARDLEKIEFDTNKLRNGEERLFWNYIRKPIERIVLRTPTPISVDERKIPVTDKLALKSYRRIKKRQQIEEEALNSLLNKVTPKGINSNQTLEEQKFSEIKWTKGEKFGDVLSRIQKRSEKP